MPRADWNVVSNGHFYYPSLPEQQKIASFLTEAQAQEIARAGGIGLAETIFDALKERMNETFDHG